MIQKPKELFTEPNTYVTYVISRAVFTLPDQKFGDKVKYTLPISAIYGLNIWSRAKM